MVFFPQKFSLKQSFLVYYLLWNFVSPLIGSRKDTEVFNYLDSIQVFPLAKWVSFGKFLSPSELSFLICKKGWVIVSLKIALSIKEII